MRFSSTAALLLTVLGTPLVAGQAKPGAPTASEFASAVQARYDRVKDFSADFVHKYRGGVLRREAIERGTLLIKKPGKMRWEYSAPEKKLFISDGVTLYSYLPQDKQVLVSKVPKADTASTPALFLAGHGNLLRDFDVSFTEVPPDMRTGTRALKLIPKVPQNDYESLVLVADSSNYTLAGLVALDAQGGTSTFSFTNFKENVNAGDQRFTFEIPRGVEVIESTAAR